jgi:hypothetical protein
MNRNQAESGMGDMALRLDEEVTEFCMLLPARQAGALEWLAQERGVTVGHLMRSLVHDYLVGQLGPEAAQPEEPPGTVFGSRTMFPV